MNRSFIGMVAVTTSLLAASAAAFEVEEIGSFHIGGRQVTLTGLPSKDVTFVAGGVPTRVDPNGEFFAEQMYVQFVRLAKPRARFPLLMWHGGGLSGVTYETKPDGKPGWQQFFLRAGHSVYVSDAVERGRASWARFPEIFKSEPLFRTKKEAWELFRIGPDGSYKDASTKPIAHPDTRFPIEAFDQFMKQGVARWIGTDDITVAAYVQLLNRVGPSVLMAHSQGGPFAVEATLKATDRVRALILLEPSGSANYGRWSFAALKGLPVLIVYGDRWKDSPRWVKTRATVDQLLQRLREAEANAEMLDLPARGIAGNSHMFMMDTNSDQIAGLIQDWLRRVGMMR